MDRHYIVFVRFFISQFGIRQNPPDFEKEIILKKLE